MASIGKQIDDLREAVRFVVTEFPLPRYVRDEAEEEVAARWLPYIDWDTYVSDTRADYTEIDVDGDTFLYR